MNFAEVVRRNAIRWPHDPVITFSGNTITHAGLDMRVSALATALSRAGVVHDDVVAILLYNCPQYLEVAFAANVIGAVFLPINFRLAPDEWRYILDHSGAKVLITEHEFHAAIDGIRPELSSLRETWATDDGGTNWVSYEARLQASIGIAAQVSPVSQTHLQRLMYTSGTTSRPKGVMITHGNVLWKNIAHIFEFGMTRADKGLVAGPLYHVGGMDLPATSLLYLGAHVVILPRFDPVAVLETIEGERITGVWLAPAMLNQVLQVRDADRYDTDSVRFVINGGEKMPLPLIKSVLELFPHAWFADAYGLTETVSGDTFLDRDHVLSKIGSVGRPVIHTQVNIVDDDDQPVKADEIGEVVLRGPKICKGYWRDDAATSTAMRGGWFHTGDVGRLDSEGYLYIEDRKKDLIISGGENIASPEVERVLYGHPAVLEAAVIGIPDERWGEVPKAFVVLKLNHSVTAPELTSFCAGQLAKFKVPKVIEFVELLPRNPSGKVLKRELRQRPTNAGRTEGRA
jgi:fatty-acyl-CoA synthase